MENQENQFEIGLFLIGKPVAIEPRKAYTDKNGLTVRTKDVAINVGGLQNAIVEVPFDYEIDLNDEDPIQIPVIASSRTYDSEKKAWSFHNVNFRLRTS